MTIKDIIEEGEKQIEFINHYNIMGKTAIVIDNNKGLNTVQEVQRHYQSKLVHHIIEMIDEAPSIAFEDMNEFCNDTVISREDLKQKLLQELGESK